MKLKIVVKAIVGLTVIFLTASLLVNSRTSSDQKDAQNDQENSWLEDTSYGVRIWIATNSVPDPRFFQRRNILLYMQPEDFAEQILRKVFIGLSQSYNEPYDLTIMAYSDRDML